METETVGRMRNIRRMGSGIAKSFRDRARWLCKDESGQGTTEYAILVGVLVVIAIVAIIAFRGKVQQLWSAIADGINSL